jgi:hypothetical protein
MLDTSFYIRLLMKMVVANVYMSVKRWDEMLRTGVESGFGLKDLNNNSIGARASLIQRSNFRRA